MTKYRTTHRVIYGDTDKMGIAYHANYFRWFEIGRAEMFREMGFTYREIENSGTFLPVSEAHCKFVAPAKYDDLIVIETAIDKTVRAGVKFQYTILTEDGKTVLAQGYTLHACKNAEGRVVRPPGFLADMITKFCQD